MNNFLYKDLTYKVIGLAMEVHRELGSGFLEKVYENALMVQLKENDIKAEQQVPIKIKYQEEIIGDYIADIVIEDKIILELKSVTKIIGIHKAQLGNYLKATGKEIGLILNFGNKSLEIERIIFQKSASSVTKEEMLKIKREKARKEREIYEAERKIRMDERAVLKTAEEIGMERGLEKGMQKGMQKGIEKGIVEGEKKKAIEIAKTLLKMGLTIDQVVEASKLSIEEIEKLK